jgi:HTH-type transcriptional regulator, sugar sensing transcriptional regulator
MRQILKQLNFSEKEIDVYLAALKLGSAPISQLAKSSGVKRPNAYFILEKMKEKGLVSLAKKKNKQIFIAEKPDKLLKLLEDQKDKLSEQQEEIKNILPKFEELTKKGSAMPIFRYYEGEKGVWNIIGDLTNSGASEARIIVPGKIFDIFGKNRFMKNVILKRQQLGMEVNIITDCHSEVVKLYNEWLKNKQKHFREYRFLPETLSIDTGVYIYANKAALIFLKEEISGLLIESEEMSKVFKFMFDSLWKELEGKNLPDSKAVEESRDIQPKQREKNNEQENKSPIDSEA